MHIETMLAAEWLNATDKKAVGREEHRLMALCQNVPSTGTGSLQDKSKLGLCLTLSKKGPEAVLHLRCTNQLATTVATCTWS